VDLKRFAVAFGREVLHSIEFGCGFLQICRVLAIRATDNLIFAGRRIDHELFGLRSAHSPGVGVDYEVIQAAAVEDAPVCIAVLLIRNIETGGIDVEGVGVLHHELPHAQQAGLWPRLIAKFRLNLIPDLRQLLVAAQLFAGDLGHNLFMCEPEAEIAAFAVFQAEKIFAHD
jgi:hypothetical protein